MATFVLSGVVAVIMVLAMALIFMRRRKREERGKERLQLSIAEGQTVPLSLHPVIDPVLCVGSFSCTQACPEGEIIGVVDGVATLVEAAHCIGHARCAVECPVGAIKLVFGTAEMGIHLPKTDENFESSREGVYIVGELGGMGLIKNALKQGLVLGQALKKKLKRSEATDIVTDVCVVGGGPAGVATAVSCRQEGLDVRILEQDSLGGCIAHYPRGKVVMTEQIEMPGYGRFGRSLLSKEELLEEMRQLVVNNKIAIEEGHKVVGIHQDGDKFVVQTQQDATVVARSVVLAIGLRGSPRKLGVPGEDLPKVVYRLVEPEQYHGKRVLIVGGGDSAVEAAIQLAEESTAKVAISYRQGSFTRCKQRNKEKIKRLIDEGRVTAYFKTRVLSIDDGVVRLTKVLDGKAEEERQRREQALLEEQRRIVAADKDVDATDPEGVPPYQRPDPAPAPPPPASPFDDVPPLDEGDPNQQMTFLMESPLEAERARTRATPPAPPEPPREPTKKSIYDKKSVTAAFRAVELPSSHDDGAPLAEPAATEVDAPKAPDRDFKAGSSTKPGGPGAPRLVTKTGTRLDNQAPPSKAGATNPNLKQRSQAPAGATNPNLKQKSQAPSTNPSLKGTPSDPAGKAAAAAGAIKKVPTGTASFKRVGSIRVAVKEGDAAGGDEKQQPRPSTKDILKPKIEADHELAPPPFALDDRFADPLADPFGNPFGIDHPDPAYDEFDAAPPTTADITDAETNMRAPRPGEGDMFAAPPGTVPMSRASTGVFGGGFGAGGAAAAGGGTRVSSIGGIGGAFQESALLDRALARPEPSRIMVMPEEIARRAAERERGRLDDERRGGRTDDEAKAAAARLTARGGGTSINVSGKLQTIEGQAGHTGHTGSMKIDKRSDDVKLKNDSVIVSIGGQLPTEFLNSVGVGTRKYHGEEKSGFGERPGKKGKPSKAQLEARSRRRLALTLFLLGLSIIVGLVMIGQEYYWLPDEARPLSPLHSLLKPSGVWGHGIGVGATTFMMANFLYALRKRWRRLKGTASIRTWLTVHMFVGIMSPLVIAFHAAFLVNNLLAVWTWIALSVVVGTGIFGRFLFGFVPAQAGKVLQVQELREQVGEMTRVIQTHMAESEDFGKANRIFDRVTTMPKEQTVVGAVLGQTGVFMRPKELDISVAEARPLFKDEEKFKLYKETAQKVAKAKMQIQFHGSLKRIFRGWLVVHVVVSVFMVLLIGAHVTVTTYLGFRWIFTETRAESTR